VFGSARDPSGAGVAHLYRGGATTTLATFYINSGGVCNAFQGSTLVYDVAEEIGPADLVALTTSSDAGRLSYRYLDGADGFLGTTRQVMHDNTLQSDCGFALGAFGYSTEYCVPQGGATAAYSDPACTTPVLVTPSSTPSPYAAPISAPISCPDVTAVYAVGAAFTPTQLYMWDSSSTCSAFAPSPGLMYYQSSSQAIALPPLVHEVAHQPGRRIQNALRTTGGLAFADRDMFDTELATWCIPNEEPDGTFTCQPEAVSISTRYDDATCSHAILVAGVDDVAARCGYAMTTFATEASGGPIKPHPILPTQLHGLYAMTSSCVADDATYYAVGDAIPHSMLATATRVTEPTSGAP
jgi:hypothetical protein